MKLSPKQIIFFIIFTFLGGYILYSLYTTQSEQYAEEMLLKGLDPNENTLLQKLIDDFKSINLFWLFVVLGLYMVSNMFRTLRWVQAMEPMGLKVKTSNAFFTLMLGYFANLGFPRIGEVARPASLAKYEKVEFEKVFGTLVTERIVDVLGLLIVILCSLILEYEALTGLLNESPFISSKLDLVADNPALVIGFLLGLPLLMLFIITRPIVRRSAIYNKVVELAKGFWEGIISIKDLTNPWKYVFYSVGIWVCYYLMTYLCFFAFTPTAHLDAGAGLLTFVFGTLGMVFPSQGGMGSYHFLVSEALIQYKVSSIDAFSFANIIFFSIQIFCNVFFGILALVALPLLNKNYKDDE